MYIGKKERNEGAYAVKVPMSISSAIGPDFLISRIL